MTDIFDDAYESDLSEEESNRLLLLCGHAVAPQLSLAAQAALAQVDATLGSELERRLLAAKALREQAVRFAGNDLLYAAVIHVAAELEGQ